MFSAPMLSLLGSSLCFGQEFVQRYLMKVRKNFQGAGTITLVVDKSKVSGVKSRYFVAVCGVACPSRDVFLGMGSILVQVGKELVTLPYIFVGELCCGAFLPPQVAGMHVWRNRFCGPPSGRHALDHCLLSGGQACRMALVL